MFLLTGTKMWSMLALHGLLVLLQGGDVFSGGMIKAPVCSDIMTDQFFVFMILYFHGLT